MEYKYIIFNDVYDWIKSGKKDVEVRLLTAKSVAINTDDIIIFTNREQEGKYIKVKVLQTKLYNSIDELVDDYSPERIMPNYNKEEIKSTLNEIYTGIEMKRQYVAIIFEIIDIK